MPKVVTEFGHDRMATDNDETCTAEIPTLSKSSKTTESRANSTRPVDIFPSHRRYIFSTPTTRRRGGLRLANYQASAQPGPRISL